MGTLCAQIAANNGFTVRLWGRNPQRIAELTKTRENKAYLPGVQLPQGIEFTGDLPAVIREADVLVCAVPTQHLRSVLRSATAAPQPGTPIISVAKGIENSTLLCPSELIAAIWPGARVGCISGPAIAREIAVALPATIVAASVHEALLALMLRLFTTPYLRVYSNADIRGVELAGATKNVIAIAAGILDGIEAGTNAKASLMTRGLVEITRLGAALGAANETFSGLAGMGDLVTTCFAPEGRNRRFGQLIGSGLSTEEALARSRGIVEGVPTTESVIDLARQYTIEMPISQCLFQVLFERKSPRAAIADLMRRQPRYEGISDTHSAPPPATNA